MTARQPQTQNEAAMLGLLTAQMGGGIFGGGRRRTRALRDGTGSTGPGAPLDAAAAPAMTASPYAAPQVDAPPPITAAPPPPPDWANQLGPEMLGNLPQQPLPTQTLPQSPPMRGGLLNNRGMFGSARAPLGSPGSPPSPAALAARVGGALNRGADTLGDTAADAMPKKKGFDWRMAAGILGDALAGLNGQQPLYAQAMYKERQARADQQRQLAEITLRSRLDAAKPDYFTAGNNRVRYDPTSGTSETLYTAPEEFELYAQSLGAEPGTPEYDRLVQDYVLRAGGPTATGLNMEEEDHRQDNRVAYEGVRQTNREKLVGQRFNNSLTLRQSPTYRQANPLPRKPAANRGGGGVREGQTATGPGGAKMVYRGGKWVPTK